MLPRLFIETLDPAKSDRRACPRPLLLVGQVQKVLRELLFGNLVQDSGDSARKLSHRQPEEPQVGRRGAAAGGVSCAESGRFLPVEGGGVPA